MNTCLLRLLLALTLLFTGNAWAADDAAPRIGVVTMQPGEVFFERFGHDALVVADPDGGQLTSYNFGFFDPSEPDFVGNFVRGRMMYYLVALPLEEDLAQYRDAGRGEQPEDGKRIWDRPTHGTLVAQARRRGKGR